MKSDGMCRVAAQLVMVAGLFGGIGCESQQQQRAMTPAPKMDKPAEKPAEKAAPAPAKADKPAAVAAAPATTGCSLAFPTGDVATSALLIKTVMPAQVRAGSSYTYEIQATNLTGGTLQNVVVNSGSYSNLAISASEPAGTKNAAGDFVWALGDLAPKATRTIKVTATAANVGKSGSCLSASYNNTLCCMTDVVQPALTITKTITPEVIICDPITMTFEVKNTGSGNADNVVISDTLPAGLTLASGGAAVNENVGTLKSGESKKFSYTLKAGKTGKFDNAAEAKADGGLTAKSQTVSTVVHQPALTIACKADDRVFLGRNVSFSLTVGNKGDAACANTTVSVPLPAGTTFVSATNGGQVQGTNIVWNVGSVAAGGSTNLGFTVKPSGISTVTAQATASCACSAPASTSCSTMVQGIPALLLDGFDDPDPVQVGETTTYTLVVTNQGTAPLTNVKLVCTGEEGSMEIVSVSETTATRAGVKVEFAPIPTLAAKATKTFKIVVKAIKEGQVQLKAEASSTEITRTLIKTETTNFYK